MHSYSVYVFQNDKNSVYQLDIIFTFYMYPQQVSWGDTLNMNVIQFIQQVLFKKHTPHSNNSLQ